MFNLLSIQKTFFFSHNNFFFFGNKLMTRPNHSASRLTRSILHSTLNVVMCLCQVIFRNCKKRRWKSMPRCKNMKTNEYKKDVKFIWWKSSIFFLFNSCFQNILKLNVKNLNQRSGRMTHVVRQQIHQSEVSGHSSSNNLFCNSS